MSRSISWRREVGLVLLLVGVAAVVRLPGVSTRSIWYDEAISLLETAGHSVPTWPRSPAPAAVAKVNFAGTPALRDVKRDLREFDTHPPLYFLALTLWRQGLGFSLEISRWLSLLFSLASVVLFYLLVRVGGLEHPVGATLFYALATGAVHHGHEARPYAMAEALILLSCLAAIGSWRESSRRHGKALFGSILMAVSAGAAFAIDYLSLFSLGVLLIWFLWAVWPRDRQVSVVGPALAIVACSPVLPMLRVQLGSRGHQFSGSVGPFAEAAAMIRMNAQEVGIALSGSGSISQELQETLSTVVALAGIAALVVLSRVWIRRQRREGAREFWVLIVALAVAPTLGVVLMDLALDKRLHEARYLAFAVPALAVLLSHGVLSAARSRQRWGMVLLVGLVSIQLARVNWGFERCVRDQTGSISRGIVEIIEGVEVPSRLVAVAGGFGQGDPAVWAYELDAETPMMVFDSDSDPRVLLSYLSQAVDIWITFASDKATLPVERELLQTLQQTGEFIVVFRNRAAIHLIRGPQLQRAHGDIDDTALTGLDLLDRIAAAKLGSSANLSKFRFFRHHGATDQPEGNPSQIPNG